MEAEIREQGLDVGGQQAIGETTEHRARKNLEDTRGKELGGAGV